MYKSLARPLSRVASRRLLSTSSPASLPPLAHAYDAYEPAISSTIMEIHHSKHHATYVNNLNACLEKAEEASKTGDANTLIALAPAIKFNGGGHINHTLFWENLCPAADSRPPAGDLAAAIDGAFGSFDAMKAEMSAKSVAVQGSGWGWLGYNKSSGSLEVRLLRLFSSSPTLPPFLTPSNTISFDLASLIAARPYSRSRASPWSPWWRARRTGGRRGRGR